MCRVKYFEYLGEKMDRQKLSGNSAKYVWNY